MTRLTQAEVDRAQRTNSSTLPHKPRKQARATTDTDSSEAFSGLPESIQSEKRKDSHPALSGPILLGAYGGHLHRWRWCVAWGQWIARCGIGRHYRPAGGQVVDVGECLRCFSLEEG